MRLDSGTEKGGSSGAAEERMPAVALAGAPNVGKSTVFNALTGLRQHTGNWPGKTVVRAEGIVGRGPREYLLVDTPGTYSRWPVLRMKRRHGISFVSVTRMPSLSSVPPPIWNGI